ncbi:leucine-rich repeat serine/threonine-protein kinase 2-like [Dysidea avara]|uniref:leucine-rich repeat serine/threonine-protein kinase 2-like n=1 Tax=Dysidea avara TaxID=196820 RepID=UPI00331FAEF3
MAHGLINEDARLHKWCKDGKYKTIEGFIATCEDLPLRLAYRRGVFGYTPLHEAVSNGHSKVLQLLLDRGGDVNCSANSGYTPLHLAASSGYVDCVRVLLNYNADISLIDEYGKTPLQTAEQSSKAAVVKVLKSAEIIKEVRNDGPRLNELLKTPLNQLEKSCIDRALMAAVESGKHSNIGKLILRGASNIDEALEESRGLRKHKVTATLLIIKAAIENDKILVLKLYDENVQGLDTKVPLTEEDDLAELQQFVRSHTIETVMPIEIARRNSASAVREELLLRRGVNETSGTVLWYGLRLTQLEISWLQNIYWVKELKIARNEFTSLPSEMGGYLNRCTNLELQWNKLREVPCCLLELPSINELNLSHNDIEKIPKVPEWSSSLSILDLSYNHLRSLPKSIVAPNLKNLNISNNQFHTVPHCVCSLTGLITLNIAYNSEILALPNELGRLKNLLNLNLDGLVDLNDPPRSIRGTTLDCINYLRSRLLSARGYYHMKLMLVGKQEMGKSTIVARLQGQEIGNESTVGVDISEWKYTPAYNKRTFYFSIWDFAGQEEYYATHQCFLSKRSLYLLVWNVTEGDAGIADLIPWLNNISVRAPNSCMIIVGTFLDKVSEENRGKVSDLLRKVQKLAAQYRRLSITKITAVGLQGQLENVAKLKDDIYNAAEEYKIENQHVMGFEIPSSYHVLMTTIHRNVKDGAHEPIMHAADFEKMVRDLNLVDLQDDEELRTVTRFLHEDGVLLHYEDRKHNLDDLYFVDSRWLCDLMSTVITVSQRNPYVQEGILHNKYIPLLFKDERFQTKYFQQYLTLLTRFEIALPLDKRILIPSLLPENRPEIVSEQLPDFKHCFKRFIIFRPSVSKGKSYRCPTSSGLWSRLLSRIMSNIKEVKNILSEYVPVKENNVVISTNIVLKSNTTALSSVSEDPSVELESVDYVYSDSTSNVSSNQSVKLEVGSVECYMPSKAHKQVVTNGNWQLEHHNKSVDVVPNEGHRNLVYWRTGLFCNVNKLCFIIESLVDTVKCQDKDGILIVCSPTPEGRRVFGQLIDYVEQLISEWYPGLEGELDHIVPCHECIKSGAAEPYEFKVDELLHLIADHKLSTECGVCHSTQQLIDLVPDLLLTDLNAEFLLDANEVIYKEEKESFLGEGGFGKVYRGKYKGQSVAVKLYTAMERISVEKRFKELRSESKLLQQLHHPCLVCMVGVTLHPTMSLVLEEAPQGSLQVSLKEKRAFPRIVMYRIAIQVSSALHFLHSINIIYRDLKAENVLLWSLSPDHLINCKVTDFNIATHADPGGSRGLRGTKGFIAPEVAHVNHLKERSVYDHRADIFSLSMFFYQLIARRLPFEKVDANEVYKYVEEGKRPQLEDIPVAESGLFYMTRIMKLCWAGSPNERPGTEEIIKCLSAPAVQLAMSVIPVSSKYSIREGCIVTSIHSREIQPESIPSELWICCDGVEGIELNVFNTHTLVNIGKHFVNQNQVRCMKQCGDHIWVASRAGLENGVVDIFNKNTKDLVHNIKIEENAVSCITNSEQLVYMGTMEGFCFVFPMDAQSIQSNIMPKRKYISEHCVDGVVFTKTCLWVSTCNQIHFLHPDSLDSDGVEKRTRNTQAFVGLMQLSDNEDQVWSSHLGGVIMSSWNAHQRVHLCDVDVGVIAKEKCQVGDPIDQIITAMCTGLDTVWIGLASGHIIVFGMNPPGEVLTYFRPYQDYVRFLSAAKYPGPCGKEECMMLSGGKMYQPDDSFKIFANKNENSKPVDTANITILWEVLPTKYMRQVHYLREGTSYLDYFNLKETIRDAGFTESMKTFPSDSTTIENKPCATINYDQAEFQQNSQQTQKQQLNVNTLHDDGTSSNDHYQIT